MRAGRTDGRRASTRSKAERYRAETVQSRSPGTPRSSSRRERSAQATRESHVEWKLLVIDILILSTFIFTILDAAYDTGRAGFSKRFESMRDYNQRDTFGELQKHIPE